MALNPREVSGARDPHDQAARLDARCADAMSLQLAGELERAKHLYRAILQTEPRHATANYCMGMLFLASNRPTDGLPNLLAALESAPEVPDYWLGLLEALLLAERTDEAAKTLELAQRHGLTGHGAADFARRLSVKILSLARQAESHVLEQVEARQFAGARSSARALTVRFPDRGLGWKVLGALLVVDGSPDEALSALRQAARLLPDDAEALCNLGATLNERGLFAEAEACLLRAIAVAPQLDDAYAHLGFACVALEKYPQAEAMYRHAVDAPHRDDTRVRDMRRHSSLLFLLSHNPSLSAAELVAEHLAIGKFFEDPSRLARRKFGHEREPERRLKVGFVSGDFRNHALANFLEPILKSLQVHTDLELHAFYNHKIEDATSRRLRTWFRQWHSVIGLTDAQLVELIETTRVDILIDLSSHTSFNRLPVFARQAAPLQVSWLGYPGTTGLRAMDYYLADQHFLPPGLFDQAFKEKIVHLPAAWTFAPHATSPPVNCLPALEAGFVTFGSFNRLGKINPLVIGLWSRLLKAVPSSILVMAAIPGDTERQSLSALFAAEGIATERLAFFPRSDMNTYLTLHNLIDICLDTFPYTGGTTTNHALWMGVPTLTLTGSTPASRQGAANLAHVGLHGFTATDPDDFVLKGEYWSTHVAALAEVRSGLRGRWLKSALRQPEAIASALDTALRHMWRRWCKDLPAQPFSVTASNQVIQ